MYDKTTPETTKIEGENHYKGECIEEKVRRLSENKEPIEDSSPLMYTNRKDGVNADYNIRTDRWDVAIEAMDKVAKAKIAQRDERERKENEAIENGKLDGAIIVTGKQIGRAHV